MKRKRNKCGRCGKMSATSLCPTCIQQLQAKWDELKRLYLERGTHDTPDR